MSSRRLLTFAAVVIALAGSGAAVAATATRTDESRPGAPREPIAAVDGTAATLGVFDEARTEADIVPARLARALESAKPDGVNIALARRAFVYGETSGYVVPSATGVCLFLVRPINDTGGCTNKVDEAPGTTFFEDRPVFYGIVPNGVDVVTLSFADRSAVISKTNGNAYYVEAPRGSAPSTISYETPDGATVKHAVYVPDVAELERKTREAMETAEG